MPVSSDYPIAGGCDETRRSRRLPLSLLAAVALPLAVGSALLAPSSGEAALRDGRVYEQVSPKFKNGASWLTSSGGFGEYGIGGMVVSPDGKRIVSSATMAFGDDVGAVVGLDTPFLLERHDEGWVSRSLSPYRYDVGGQLSATVRGFSNDLSVLSFTTIGRLSERDDDRGAGDGTVDDYVLDGTSAGAKPRLLTCPDAPAPACTSTAYPALGFSGQSGGWTNSVSGDGSVVAFETAEPMLPGISGAQIYTRSGPGLDQVRRVSEPLDTVPTGATQVSGTPSLLNDVNMFVGTQPNSAGAVAFWENPISQNGSRVFFASPMPTSPFADAISRIYVRVDGQRTLEVSRVRGGVGAAQKVKFRGASIDGSRALITTQQALLSASGASPARTDPNTVEDLYLWTHDPVGDPRNDDPNALTRINGLPQVGPGPAADGQSGLSVLGISDDATTVYFSTRANTATASHANVYVATLPADDPAQGTVRFIATAATASPTTANTFGGCLNPRTNAGVATTCARSSSDGGYLVFESRVPLTDDDSETGCSTDAGGPIGPGAIRPTGEPAAIPAACRNDVFRFDHETSSLVRVSTAGPGGTDNGAHDAHLGINGRSVRVSDDGASVFFVSTERLDPDDVNQVWDVYEWHQGKVSLISGGTGNVNSALIGASRDGSDVFFATVEGLRSDDTDQGMDIYNARVGGGFPAKPVDDCQGNACQGGGGNPPPPVPAPGSVSLLGSGNVAPPAPLKSPARATVAKVKTVRGKSVALRVKVPSRGRLKVRGSGVRRSAKGATRSVSRQGTYRLRVRLTPRATRTLQRKRQVKIRARVTYTPRGGKAQIVQLRITFKSAAKKRGTR